MHGRHVLWLAGGDFDSELDRMRNHLLDGEGESIDIKSRLENGNTDSGNLTISIFTSELQHIEKYNDWTKRFYSTLALTMAATDSICWMCDKEEPELLHAKCESSPAFGVPNYSSAPTENLDSDSRKKQWMRMA